MSKVFRTDRLLLRQWVVEDRQILATINNDPEVMRYFPGRFTEEESHAFVDVNAERIANNGWGSWAVETINSGEFIGFVGFEHPRIDSASSLRKHVVYRLDKGGYSTRLR